MEQHINYITLGVSDLPASRRFYREVFGWQENENSNEHIAFFQTGGALVFALFARDSLVADAHLSAASPSGFPPFHIGAQCGQRSRSQCAVCRFCRTRREHYQSPAKSVLRRIQRLYRRPRRLFMGNCLQPLFTKIALRQPENELTSLMPNPKPPV